MSGIFYELDGEPLYSLLSDNSNSHLILQKISSNALPQWVSCAAEVLGLGVAIIIAVSGGKSLRVSAVIKLVGRSARSAVGGLDAEWILYEFINYM